MKHQQMVRSQEIEADPCEAVRREVNLSGQAVDIDPPNLAADCEVIEYDPESGDAAWQDSMYVQDFTDSVLQTIPAPLSD